MCTSGSRRQLTGRAPKTFAGASAAAASSGAKATVAAAASSSAKATAATATTSFFRCLASAAADALSLSPLLPNRHTFVVTAVLRCSCGNHVPSPPFLPQARPSVTPALHSHAHAAANLIPRPRNGKRIAPPPATSIAHAASICSGSNAVFEPQQQQDRPQRAAWLQMARRTFGCSSAIKIEKAPDAMWPATTTEPAA